jgi:hypothetical protein
MSQTSKRIYLPPRNLVGSLVPTIIATWYFIDKVGSNTHLKVILVTIALIVQVIVVAVSTRTRKTRRSFFWGIYDFLTGNGRLPLRLFVNGIVILAVIALGFEISGLQRSEPTPSSFIVRYVEVYLYWTVLNFLGISDSSITAVGFSKFLTVLATVTGIVFWGMYISILVNKYTDIQELFKSKLPNDELDDVLYNEPNQTSQPTDSASKLRDEKSSSLLSDNTTSTKKYGNTENIKNSDEQTLAVLFGISGFVLWSTVIIFALFKNRNNK